MFSRHVLLDRQTEDTKSLGAQAGYSPLQSVLLADQSEKLDSMNLLRLMAPIAATLTLPAVALLEPTAPHVAWRLLLTQPGFAVLLVGNASLAYVVNFTNFQVTHYTSALTLQVCILLWSTSVYQNPYHHLRLHRLWSCSVVLTSVQSPLCPGW